MSVRDRASTTSSRKNCSRATALERGSISGRSSSCIQSADTQGWLWREHRAGEGAHACGQRDAACADDCAPHAEPRGRLLAVAHPRSHALSYASAAPEADRARVRVVTGPWHKHGIRTAHSHAVVCVGRDCDDAKLSGEPLALQTVLRSSMYSVHVGHVHICALSLSADSPVLFWPWGKMGVSMVCTRLLL